MADWPISVRIDVAWGDLDAFNHVNNTVYFRWFETARIALFDRLGIRERMERDHIGPILARTTCDFRLPLGFPDTIFAEAAVAKIGRTSYVLHKRVRSVSRGAIAAEGEAVIVTIDYRTGEKVPLDEITKQQLAELVLAEAPAP